ncbi:hypothetical protein [Yinghuangia sp. YIM S09857]|uniref:hypothetical protein n=1 Tax=Yinghuangia sp. YIM S09857 TaxID=3436929 RepID=UPI003F52B7DD
MVSLEKHTIIYMFSLGRSQHIDRMTLRAREAGSSITWYRRDGQVRTSDFNWAAPEAVRNVLRIEGPFITTAMVVCSERDCSVHTRVLV